MKGIVVDTPAAMKESCKTICVYVVDASNCPDMKNNLVSDW